MDDQGNLQAFVDGAQAFEIELRLTLHAPVHGADGYSEKIDTGLLHIGLSLLHRGVDHIARVLLSVLAFHIV